eukprot:6202483-Pleurochrysis_carterae.AAC.1
MENVAHHIPASDKAEAKGLVIYLLGDSAPTLYPPSESLIPTATASEGLPQAINSLVQALLDLQTVPDTSAIRQAARDITIGIDLAPLSKIYVSAILSLAPALAEAAGGYDRSFGW